MRKLGFIQENNTKKSVEQTSIIVPKNFTHSYVVGQTGCGKTSSFIYPNLDDRIKNGHGILIFNYKGSEDKAVKFFADKHRRLEDVIEIGVPWGVHINLISAMNEKELKSFVVSLMSMKAENDYFSESGSNLVVTIWKSIKAYIEIIEEADKINNKKSYLGTVVKFKLPTALTFAEIANICKSTVSIASFHNKVIKLSERFEKTLNSKIEEWLERHDEVVVKNKYLDLMTSVLHNKDIVETGMKSLDVFSDSLEGSKNSSMTTLIMSMSTTFASVADNNAFNSEDGLDLAHELDQGKIIIINSQEISSVVLGSLVSSTLQELSKRVRQTKINPVSVFIDEAQRVLAGGGGSIDLHTDVCRASFIEIFLSFQNYSLMQNAIGELNFKALILNLVSSYHFKNGVVVDDLETNKLKEFECFINGEDTIHAAIPIFIDPEEIYTVELEYFKRNNIYEMLNIDEKYRDQVIQFNPILYQKNQIDLKAKDGTLTTIKLRDKKRELESLKVIDELILNHQVVVTHKKYVQQQNRRKSQPTLSDLVGERLSEVNEFMDSEE